MRPALPVMISGYSLLNMSSKVWSINHKINRRRRADASTLRFAGGDLTLTWRTLVVILRCWPSHKPHEMTAFLKASSQLIRCGCLNVCMQRLHISNPIANSCSGTDNTSEPYLPQLVLSSPSAYKAGSALHLWAYLHCSDHGERDD